ncbi:MAG: hypothetical protein IJS53_05535 [Clostridia bacterium]|nr:hypothetical protein [Clostridia bacterium]
MNSYQEDFLLRTRDCDVNGQWRPSAILEAMQEVSGAHCALLGIGRSELMKRGIAWVASRREVQMERYPDIGERVTVRTFHKPVRLRFFPRYYLFLDARGEVIGKAGTLWLLMDVHTRQALPAGEMGANLPDNSNLPAPMGLPAAVAPLQGEERAWEYLPQYSDLDENGHVNNTRYADWLCNALGIECMQENRLRSLVLNYNAEVLPGNALTLRLTRSGPLFRLAVTNGDKTAFEAGGELGVRGIHNS